MFAVLAFSAAAPVARSGNVDLSTVPERKSVQLTIYNSEDLTLVRETRVVTFKKGANPLQFSWANTLIDPSSVELKFLTAADQLDVLDTTFPHDKPQMLYWNVESELDGEATIQITYFTSGITWSADYVGIASADESTMDAEGFVRVTNNSGEEYDDAQIRLVVGTINLVEKIAQLAQIPMSAVAEMKSEELSTLRRSAAMDAMGSVSGRGGQSGPAPADGKEIIKEGLSEYFIYTVEGTETIPNGWSKRMRSFEAEDVPLKIEYRYRPKEYGDQLVRMYLMTNDKPSNLGTTPLPDGAIRVFRDNGRDGLSFLTQQTIKYIPIGDKIELNLGPDPEVIFELVKLRSFRDAIWMQINGTNKYQQVGEDAQRTEVNSSVAGWDDHSVFAQRIRNYTSQPIGVEMRRTYDGHVVFRSPLEPKLHDYQTVEFRAGVPPGERTELLFEVVQHHGYNAKQNNVTLEAAEVVRD
ncbi:MAG: hypothetical protein WD851_13475 [Pirellulales bacterium]